MAKRKQMRTWTLEYHLEMNSSAVALQTVVSEKSNKKQNQIFLIRNMFETNTDGLVRRTCTYSVRRGQLKNITKQLLLKQCDDYINEREEDMVELQTRIKAIKEDLKETDDVYEFLKNSTSNTLGTGSKFFLEHSIFRTSIYTLE